MYNLCKKTGAVSINRIRIYRVLVFLIMIAVLGGCATSTAANQTKSDITEPSEFTLFSLGVRNDPDFMQEVLDAFIKKQGGYVFPRIISKNISHLYMRILPSGGVEVSADVTISHWFLDTLLDSLLPQQFTEQGVPFYEFGGSVIIVNSAGVVMLPLKDFTDPLYTYIEPNRIYTYDRYVHLESGLSGSVLTPIESGKAVSYQVTRVGRKKYQVEGFAQFETVAAARSSMTSLRLKLAKDFSKSFSAGVSLEEKSVHMYHESLTRQEIIDLIFYIGNM